MNNMGGEGIGLWDEADGFYYDVLHAKDSPHIPIKIRSMVGLIPLFATETFEPEDYERLPGFRGRMQWFLDHNPDIAEHVDMSQRTEHGPRLLLSIAGRKKLERIYRYVFDEHEFLSPHGVRALSKFHGSHPFTIVVDGQSHTVDYEPAESTTDLLICLAAIPIGAVPSGSRPISCSSNRSSEFTTITVTSSKSSAQRAREIK
jgi:hypothetical protein